VAWFFAEHLLEARAGSRFPTNTAGRDEDVNAYLIGLLGAWAVQDPRAGVLPGIDPLLAPPAGGGRLARARHYRHQADHRLLALGLHDRGDLVRRRRVGWRLTEQETRRRDLAVVRHGYAAAAELARGRDGCWPALVAVWEKLARQADDYVHVLQVLARRRLGLGARLDDGALARLLRPSRP
jgi:hypothetical protein